ncbi:MAG TPA: HD domain-containing protein [Thermoanaerobaculia bacterium]|nr:HD domain-containing protein [Thermoanaerobaculia bacterium]
MLSLRDPVHGFIRADPLEAALVNSRPVQRLRFIHQLGLTFLVFPGAEHSRFSHALGAMHLAGRVYDVLCSHVASQAGGPARGRAGVLLPGGAASRERRLVRAAALLHDLGHAPFSHSAEELFEGGIDHEEMTRRLIATREVAEVFARFGDGLVPADVIRLLAGGEGPTERLLAQVVSGELDVDKMDYLLRDSLFCGVRYGSYDLDRLLDTMRPIEDPQTGAWGIGVDEGGVHALEALVMARYYMFTQVYFNVTGKALELHLNEWLAGSGRRWPADPEAFLAEDDVTVWAEMRRSDSVHARAVVARGHFPVAFETREHLARHEKQAFEALLPGLRERFGAGNVLTSNSAKDPHRLGRSRVLVRRFDGALEPMAEASQFIRHLARIDRYRVYTPHSLRAEVGGALRELWPPDPKS